MKLVVNSSPLILLAACLRLELLKELASEVVVPRAVLRELEAGRGRDRAAEAVQGAGWIRLHEDLLLPQVVASWDLGAGESRVLAVADAAKAIAVLDDRAARNCAQAMALPLAGTLGTWPPRSRRACCRQSGPSSRSSGKPVFICPKGSLQQP